MKKLLLSFAVLATLGVFAVIAFIMHVASDLPSVEKIRNYQPPVPTIVYDRNDQVLMQLGNEYREVVPYKKIPKTMIHAVLAAEDSDFFHHSGVDIFGLMRAMGKNLLAAKVVQGGSTITQQVAKALLLNNEKTMMRKVKDFLLAMNIEEAFSKEEILFLYLNQSYLGSGHYGIAAAAKGYFGKDLANISIAEAAMLAGLLSAPGRYSPFLNAHFCKRRQLYVLERMRANGFISPAEYASSKAENIKLLIRQEKVLAPFFTEWIRQLVADEIGEEAFYSQGLKIKTTLDKNLQLKAESSIKKGVTLVDQRQGYIKPDHQLAEKNLVEGDEKLKKQLIEENAEYKILTTTGELLNEYESIPTAASAAPSDSRTSATSATETVTTTTTTAKNTEKNNDKNKSNNVVSNELFANYLKASDDLSKEISAQVLAPFQENKILAPLCKPEKRYQALVLKVNAPLRLVYISIGGEVGIIPWDYYKWAHARKISDSTTFSYLQVNDPQSLFTPGDHIMVEYLPDVKKRIIELVPNEVKKNLTPALKTYANQLSFKVFKLVQPEKVEAALISLDVQTSEMLAMVGGKDFSKSKFNRSVQALRQPGSSIKPFLYAAALEQSFTPMTLLMDAPQALSGVDQLSAWRPKNYDNEFKGLIPLRMSLEESRNVSTIYLMQQLGIKKVKQLLYRAGIRGKIPDDMSISLGSFGVSLIDLVSAYRMFPSYGQKTKRKIIEKITDRNGKFLTELEEKIDAKINQHIAEAKTETKTEAKTETKTEAKIESKTESSKEANSEKQVASKEGENNADVKKDLTNTDDKAEKSDLKNENKNDGKKTFIDFVSKLNSHQVLDDRLSFMMISLLQGVIARGTAQDLSSMGQDLAGKTGTTSDYVDSWFVGFTSKVVTGVWVGFDDNTTLGYGETGSQAAMPIWKDYMSEVISKNPLVPFVRPAGLEAHLVNRKTGKIVKAPGADTIVEYLVPGTLQTGPQVQESLMGALTMDKNQNDNRDADENKAKALLPEADEYWSQQ